MLNKDEHIPIYGIFILILILSGGYTIQLIPCRLQRLLNENIYIKHIFCLLTLIFLVNLTDPEQDKTNLKNILYKSFILYLFFMIIIKTQYKFFMLILLIIGIIYLFEIKKNEYEDNDTKKPNLETEKNIKYITYIQNILFIIMCVFMIIGFMTYLGEKKYEYKDKFNFITFIFGKPDCTFSHKKISIKNSIIHAFD